MKTKKKTVKNNGKTCVVPVRLNPRTHHRLLKEARRQSSLLGRRVSVKEVVISILKSEIPPDHCQHNNIQKNGELPSDSDQLLSVDQFLVWLGKPIVPKMRRWVMRLAREGKIPALKVGREWRFHRPTIVKKCSTGLT